MMAKRSLKDVITAAEQLLVQHRRDKERLSRLFVRRRTDIVDVTTNLALDESVRIPAEQALAQLDIAISEFKAFSAGMAITLTWLRGQLSDGLLDVFDRLDDRSAIGGKMVAVLTAGVAHSYVFVITRLCVSTRELEAICRSGARPETKARLEALGKFVAQVGVDEVAAWSKVELVAKLGQLMAVMAGVTPAPIGAMLKTGQWNAQQRELAVAFKAWRKATLPLMMAAHEQMVASMGLDDTAPAIPTK